jgi:hypothetical protein
VTLVELCLFLEWASAGSLVNECGSGAGGGLVGVTGLVSCSLWPWEDLACSKAGVKELGEPEDEVVMVGHLLGLASTWRAQPAAWLNRELGCHL